MSIIWNAQRATQKNLKQVNSLLNPTCKTTEELTFWEFLQGLAHSSANVVHFECAARDAGLISKWQRSALVVSLADALERVGRATGCYVWMCVWVATGW